MEIKTLLTEERSITFKPVEGKEYTKHKYTIKKYTDLEYIEDIINEAEEYEMEEKEYKAVSIFYVDDNPIIKVLSEEYEDAIDVVFNCVYPELKPIKNEIDIFGEYKVRHQFPYDTLMKDGRWTEEVTNFNTEDTDLKDINRIKIHEINVGEDEIYYTTQIPKFNEKTGYYEGYEEVKNHICKFEFYTSFYSLTVNNPIKIKTKDEHGYEIHEVAMYEFKNSLDTASELIMSTTPILLNKYASLISDVFNKKELLRSNIFQELRVDISEILDSLKYNLFNIEHSIERDNKMTDESKRNVYESRLKTYKGNKTMGLINKMVEDYGKETNTNLDAKFYNYIDEEDKLYKNVKDVIKDEVLEVISIVYHNNKNNKCNNSMSGFVYNGTADDDKTIYITKDNRIFISTNILSNIFNNIEILNNIPKKTFYEMIESLGLTILMYSEYDLYKIDHMMYNLYWEITSPKQMMTRTINSLLGGNFNIRTDEILEYVNELKNIIKEVKDIVNNK